MTLNAKEIRDAMAADLLAAVKEAYAQNMGTTPTLQEISDACDAIDELLLSLNVENMTAGELQSIAAELGISGIVKSRVQVDDRRAQSRS